MRILQNFDTNTVCAIDYIFVYETIGVCIPIKDMHTNYPFRMVLTQITTWVFNDVSQLKIPTE